MLMALAVAKTTPVLLGAAGDYTPLQVGPNGELWSTNLPSPLVQNGADQQDLTIDSSTTLTPAAGATHLMIQSIISGKNVSITFDGTTPTTTFGWVQVALDPPVLIAVGTKTFKVIAITAGAAIQYAWYGS